MANSRVLAFSASNLLNNYRFARCNLAIFKKGYSVFPKHYVQPITSKDEQEAVLQSEGDRAISHKMIKPALTTDTCSEFYDPKVLKFINVLMRHGNKILAKELVAKAFERVKRIQIQRYHKAATDEEKEKIVLDPFVVFHSALSNCTPILQLVSYKKGGITYKVPIPITATKAQHVAMKWLIEAANDKERDIRFYDVLAKELVSASQNQGGAVRRKQELNKKCQENRAYAHFRWS